MSPKSRPPSKPTALLIWIAVECSHMPPVSGEVIADRSEAGARQRAKIFRSRGCWRFYCVELPNPIQVKAP